LAAYGTKASEPEPGHVARSRYGVLGCQPDEHG
jgi:hypothetical protein